MDFKHIVRTDGIAGCTGYTFFPVHLNDLVSLLITDFGHARIQL